jgi:uncharacterized RDD family membrane protein YckC
MPAAPVFCNRCGFSSGIDAQFCQRCGAALASPGIPLASAPAVAVPRYAGFWVRVMASIIDMILLLAALHAARLLVGSAATALGLGLQADIHKIFVARRIARFVVGILIACSYKAGMESSAYQATLGKMALRLIVTDLDGRRITLARAIARYFAKYLSVLTLMIGYLMVAFDEQKQGLHDRIAGTLVLRRDRSW